MYYLSSKIPNRFTGIIQETLAGDNFYAHFTAPGFQVFNRLQN